MESHNQELAGMPKRPEHLPARTLYKKGPLIIRKETAMGRESAIGAGVAASRCGSTQCANDDAVAEEKGAARRPPTSHQRP